MVAAALWTSGMLFLSNGSALLWILLVAVPLPTYGGSAEVIKSHACSDQSCSTHNLTCGQGGRLAITSAYHGFKPLPILQQCSSNVSDSSCSSQMCCGYNATTDCTEVFDSYEMGQLRNQCSYKQYCNILVPTRAATACRGLIGAANSSLSIVEAICIPENGTTDPCQNVTMFGDVLSIFLIFPPPTQACRCRMDSSSTNNSKIRLYTYDIQSRAQDRWAVEVKNDDLVWSHSGGASSEFPAALVTSTTLTSLSVECAFPADSNANPITVWFGFHSDTPSLTMRCGDHTVFYEEELERLKTTVIYNSNHAIATRSPVIEAVNPSDAIHIIIYAGVAIGLLVFMAFLRVGYTKFTKRGCPSCCPEALQCYDVENNKWSCCSLCDKEQTTEEQPQPNGNAMRRTRSASTINSNGTSETTTPTVDTPDGTPSTPAPTPNGAVAYSISNGVVLNVRRYAVNGRHLVRHHSDGEMMRRHHYDVYDYDDYDDDNNHAFNIHIPHDLVFRKKLSLASLRSRASLSNLEEIAESDEESRFSTLYNHSNLVEQRRLFELVHSKLAHLAVQDDEEDKNNDNTGDNNRNVGDHNDNAGDNNNDNHDSHNDGNEEAENESQTNDKAATTAALSSTTANTIGPKENDGHLDNTTDCDLIENKLGSNSNNNDSSTISDKIAEANRINSTTTDNINTTINVKRESIMSSKPSSISAQGSHVLLPFGHGTVPDKHWKKRNEGQEELVGDSFVFFRLGIEESNDAGIVKNAIKEVDTDL